MSAMPLSERFRDAWNVLTGLRRVSKQSLPPHEPVGSTPTADPLAPAHAYKHFVTSTYLGMTRAEIYDDMDEMLQYVLVAAAADAFCDDASQKDERRQAVVWPTAANPRVVAEIFRMFASIELDVRAYGDIWSLAQYGDLFSINQYSRQRGIFDSIHLEPRIVSRVEDLRRVVRGYNVGDLSQDAYEPDNIPECAYQPWDVNHWRLRTLRPTWRYGTPQFFFGRGTYKRLRLMEECMVIYRMKMHPDRLLHKIFTGTSSPDEARRIVSRWKREMERNTAIDHISGQYHSEWAPHAIDQDIYWPVGLNDTVSGVEKFPGCFTGDTKIALLDGTEVAIQDLVGRSEFWTYSFGRDGSFYPGRGHSARLTKQNAEILKVTLDNGESIRCTPDHRFMLRDGSYKEAQYLTPADSLMPLYRKRDRYGYEMIASNRRYRAQRALHCGRCGRNGHNRRTCGRLPSQNWVHTHRLVSREAEGERIPTGVVIHHVDFDRRNNAPSNLRRMTVAAHDALHAENMERSLHSAESKRKAAVSARRRYRDAAWRKKKCRQQSALMTSMWKDEEFAQKALTNLTTQTTEDLSQNAEKANRMRWHEKRGVKSTRCRICVGNHRVVSVESAGRADVYDITVDTYHNFSLSAGVVVHNSGNAGDVFDIQHMRDQLFSILKVPKAFLGLEDSQGYRSEDTLSQQSVKFARSVKRLRDFYLSGIEQLCRVHLTLRGYDPSDASNSFKLHMAPVSYLDEAHKAELYAKRAESVRYILEIGTMLKEHLPNLNMGAWASYVLSEFSGMDNTLIARLLAPTSGGEGGEKADLTFSPGGTQQVFEKASPRMRQYLASKMADDPRLAEAIDAITASEGLEAPGMRSRMIRSGIAKRVKASDPGRVREMVAASEAATQAKNARVMEEHKRRLSEIEKYTRGEDGRSEAGEP